MSSEIATRAASRQGNGAAMLVVPALLLGLAVLGVLFSAEILAALRVWRDSTAYGHCYLIIPIAVFLAWERRFEALVTPVRPMPRVALLALPLGLVWLVVERLGIMEGQQFIAIGFVEVLFAAVLGWRMCRVLAVPLLYLVFLVPFGAFATSALQTFTAAFVTHGLDVLGISNYSDGFTIEIPEGLFFVAEACAGLRFLIASIAFGVLYACVIYRSPSKRVVFIALSVVIPIVANGFRGLGIVVLGHLLGSAQAATVDHIVYGWIFFSVVILTLIMAGLPFRDHPLPRPTAAVVAPVAPPRAALVRATLAVLLLTAIAPAAAALLDHKAESVPLAVAAPVQIAGCAVASTGMVDGGVRLVYQCGTGGPASELLTLIAVSPRANPGTLVRLRHAITGDLGADDVETLPLPGHDGANWQLVTTIDPDRLIAVATWVDGKPATGGFAQRRQQAWASVFGADAASVMLTIATPGSVTKMSPAAHQAALAGITSLLDRNPDLSAAIVALASAAVQR